MASGINKGFNSPELEQELSDLLDTISKIKGDDYGMIVRTVFNLHNVTSFSIRLLEDTKRMSESDMQIISDHTDKALADAAMTLAKLYFAGHPEKPLLEMINWATDFEIDLNTLVDKQAEYNKE